MVQKCFLRGANMCQVLNTASAEVPPIWVFIGPSGCGKTSLCEHLESRGIARRARSHTTRKRRDGEAADAYHFVTVEEFERLKRKGFFIETNLFGKNQDYYGLSFEEVQNAQNFCRSRQAMITTEPAGLENLKTGLGRSSMKICDILVPEDIRRQRLIQSGNSLEQADARIARDRENYPYGGECDLVVYNTGTIPELAEKIIRAFSIRL